MRIYRGLAMISISVMLLSGLLPSVASSAYMTVRWTTPGDDGYIGRATAYDLRYSTVPITTANFASRTVVTGLPTPKTAGVADSFSVSGLLPGAPYYFALKTRDEASNWSPISNVALRYTALLAVDDFSEPLAFSGPWPNPAVQLAHFAYALPKAAHIEVEAFDISGRRVRSIASGNREAGRGDLTWDLHDSSGRRVEPGIYLVHMRTTGANWVKRVVVSG